EPKPFTGGEGLEHGRAVGPRSRIARLLAAAGAVRAWAPESTAVLSAYALVAVAVTWPLAAHLSSRMLGPFPNDGSGTVAFFWETRHEGGYRLFGTTHHFLTGAPLGWDQGSALNWQWLWP